MTCIPVGVALSWLSSLSHPVPPPGPPAGLRGEKKNNKQQQQQQQHIENEIS